MANVVLSVIEDSGFVNACIVTVEGVTVITGEEIAVVNDHE